MTKFRCAPANNHRASIKLPIRVPASLPSAVACYSCREVSFNYGKSLLSHGGDMEYSKDPSLA
jgi:hypothetical protein